MSFPSCCSPQCAPGRLVQRGTWSKACACGDDPTTPPGVLPGVGEWRGGLQGCNPPIPCRQLVLTGGHPTGELAFLGIWGDRGWLILPRTGHVNRQDPHPHLSPLLPGSSPSLLWVCWCGTLEGWAKRGPAGQSQCQHPCHLLLQWGTQNLSPTFLYPPLHPACPDAAGLASLPAASEPWGAAHGSCPKELPNSGTEEMAELLGPWVSVPEAAFPWGPSQGN